MESVWVFKVGLFSLIANVRYIKFWHDSNALHEKFDPHQIYSGQIWCKKLQTKVK